MRPILVCGAQGTLGASFVRICENRTIDTVPTTRGQLDIADRSAVGQVLDACQPWAVVNAAGYVRVDDAEHDAAACFRSNADGPAILAAECDARGVQLLTFSSDLVFDGDKRSPYVESDQPRPLSVYGRSKVAAEVRVLEPFPKALVVRTGAFFGPWDAANFATRALTLIRSGQPMEAARDGTVSPTYVPDLVHACLDLLIDGESGIWHLSNGMALTWADAARATARAAGISNADIRVSATTEPSDATRPVYSALNSERGLLLPTLDDAISRWAALVA